MQGLPTLKLHKLLYYVQAHHLASTGEPMFAETVSAWDKGPVVVALWDAERDASAAPPSRQLADGQRNVLDYVVSRYGKLSGTDLMHLTRAEDPWLLANQNRPAGGSVRIRNEWMQDYFRSDAVHDDGEVRFTNQKVAALTAGAAERRRNLGPADRDETDQLRASLDELTAQLSACPRPWLLAGFDEWITRWVRDYAPTLSTIVAVRGWVLSRAEDPFDGAKFVKGSDDYLFCAIPGSMGEHGRVVTCAYWIHRDDRTVRCDTISAASWPV